MKKRLVLFLTIGVTFSPAVIAAETGSNVLSQSNMTGVVCDQDRAVKNLKSSTSVSTRSSTVKKSGKTQATALDEDLN